MVARAMLGANEPAAETPAEILVVDDEQSMREVIGISLKKEGYAVTTASNVKEALHAVESATFDLVISDLKMPDGSGLDVLRVVKQQRPETQVIICTAFATMENAIEAMRLGAYDYQLKPFAVSELRLVVSRALEKTALIKENRALKDQLHGKVGTRLIGKSSAIGQVLALLDKVAKTRTNVIVFGESGTGKELVAREIHDRSERASKRFVAVNCGAIPETLIESELFGHKKGAFTGASSDREGLFEAAHGGTLFLDEIGDLPQPMQVKLLRALQERTVTRVGDTAPVSVDVRVVAATHRNLQDEVKAGRFREDLFYRLNVIALNLPSLRERREDIPLLVDHFIKKHGGDRPLSFAPDAMRALLDYDFPGNVRELENVVERAMALADGAVMSKDVLPASLTTPKDSQPLRLVLGPEGIDIEGTLDAIELDLINQALKFTGGAKKKAAGLLKLTFRSFRYRLDKHGIGASLRDDEKDED